MPSTPMAVRRARFAILTIFAIMGIAYGNWVVRIPAVQERLDLSDGRLGLALLMLPFGAILAMPLAGSWIARSGSRVVATVTTLAFSAALVLPGLAPNLHVLCAALFIFGMTSGALDVAMNAHGVAVEKRFGRSTMSAFHASFSLAGMLGAAAGGLLAELGLGTGAHLGSVAVALVTTSLVATRGLLPAGVDAVGAARAGPVFAPIPRAVLALGVVGFCALLAEGSIADWSAVYLDRALDASPGVAAAGYATFSLAMFIGRVLGDRLTDRIGPEQIVRWGGLLAAGGLALALASPWAAPALAGFGLTGLGLAVIVPVIFSAAGRSSDVAPGRGIAAVTTTGYFGFLAGPPIIGFLAGPLSLRLALVVVVLLCLLMSSLAAAARPAGTPREPRPSRAAGMLGLPERSGRVTGDG